MVEKVALLAALIFGVSLAPSLACAQAAPASAPGVFHHFHLNSLDPASNMEYFSKNYGSIKVILQGFGVGVRMANAYALWERVDEEIPAHPWANVPAWACKDPDRCFEDARVRFEMYPPGTGGLVARLQVLMNDPAAAGKWFQDHLGVDPALGKTPILFVRHAGPLENGKVFDHVAFSYPDLASAVKRLTAEGVQVIERKPLSVIVAGPEGFRVEIAEDSDVGANAYWCPMDPKIRASKPGKCPVCGMRLVPLDPGEYVAYPVELTTSPNPVRAGHPAKLTFTIENPHTEAPVMNYETVHEKEFHLFIVSHDFSFFEHIHPVLQKSGPQKGSWIVETTLPKPGAYQAFADFFPTGGTPQIIEKAFVTAGYTGSFLDARAKLTPDATPVKDEGDTRIRLDSTGYISGLKQTLTFTVTDEKTGAPVKDLEPYLGAGAHMLILSEDLGDYVHGHAMLDANTPGVLTIETLFPRESNYRIWIQFQRAGRLITTHFTVAVKRLH